MFYTNSQPFLEIFSNVCKCNYLHLRLKIYTYLALFFLTLLVSQSTKFTPKWCDIVGWNALNWHFWVSAPFADDVQH